MSVDLSSARAMREEALVGCLPALPTDWYDDLRHSLHEATLVIDRKTGKLSLAPHATAKEGETVFVNIQTLRQSAERNSFYDIRIELFDRSSGTIMPIDASTVHLRLVPQKARCASIDAVCGTDGVLALKNIVGNCPYQFVFADWTGPMADVIGKPTIDGDSTAAQTQNVGATLHEVGGTIVDTGGSFSSVRGSAWRIGH